MFSHYYWELFLFGGMAFILVVYLAAYFAALWHGEQRRWHKIKQNKLQSEDDTYYLKGYDARPVRDNIRRA